MHDKTVSVNVGGGFPALLTTLFVGLKLTNYISWPWVWVLSPLWIPLLLWLIFAVIFVVIYLMANKK